MSLHSLHSTVPFVRHDELIKMSLFYPIYRRLKIAINCNLLIVIYNLLQFMGNSTQLNAIHKQL